MIHSFKEAYNYMKHQNRKDLLSSELTKKLKRIEHMSIDELIQLNSEINTTLSTCNKNDRQANLLKIILAEVSAQEQRYRQIKQVEEEASRIKVINTLRSKVSFYGIYNMQDRLDQA